MITVFKSSPQSNPDLAGLGTCQGPQVKLVVSVLKETPLSLWLLSLCLGRHAAAARRANKKGVSYWGACLYRALFQRVEVPWDSIILSTNGKMGNLIKATPIRCPVLPTMKNSLPVTFNRILLQYHISLS